MNSVTIIPTSNSIAVASSANSVETSLFDIHTTAYFLQAHTMIEEHRPVKTAPDKEAEPDEL